MTAGKGTYGTKVGKQKINKGTTGPTGPKMKPKQNYFEMAEKKMEGKK